jgi:hypothetical protein
MSDPGFPYMSLEDVIGLLKKRDDEIARLQTVVDAARPICLRWETRGLGPNLPGETPTDADLLNALCAILRILDGEVKP